MNGFLFTIDQFCEASLVVLILVTLLVLVTTHPRQALDCNTITSWKTKINNNIF